MHGATADTDMPVLGMEREDVGHYLPIESAHGRTPRGRDLSDLACFLTPARVFVGARHGWAFKMGQVGLGYYRDGGAIRVRLADHCAPPQPRQPRPISLANAINAVSAVHPPPPHGIEGLEDGYLTWLERRAAQAADVARRRRQPRRVPRRRAAGRNAGRALPAAAAQSDVMPHCTAEAEEHRRKGLWAFDCVNANCWDTALKYVQKSAADITGLQETKIRVGEDTAAAQDTAAQLG